MRLFAAVDPGSENRAALDKYISAQRKRGALGDFTRAANLHLTLAFIGETERVDEAVAALDTLDFKSFTFSSDHLGTFSRDGGDILWLGLKPCPELEQLAASAAYALRSRGFSIEKRAFAPHLTLGRRVTRCDMQLSPPAFTAHVDQAALMNSARVGGVLTYTPVHIRLARN